jgi:thioredoxin reductase (NADPH)
MERDDPSSQILDCLIVGSGPAGLTAAIYLTRFHLSVSIIDSGKSRATLIPLSRNHAGFPEGIPGTDLLARMRRQAAQYGARLQNGEVSRLSHEAGRFIGQIGGSTVRARTVLLATGVTNRRPAMMDDACHDQALATGLLRYCPICDGYEVTDKSIAVLGTGERGYKEAVFLRSYSADVTLVAPEGEHQLTAKQRGDLAAAGVALLGHCTAIRIVSDRIALVSESKTRCFDTLYPALGSEIHSQLGGAVGADRTQDGCLIVDAHQRTNVTGLYAAGDVVLGLDQISHAMGEGGVAATTIRNDLAEATPLRR